LQEVIPGRLHSNLVGSPMIMSLLRPKLILEKSIRYLVLKKDKKEFGHFHLGSILLVADDIRRPSKQFSFLEMSFPKIQDLVGVTESLCFFVYPLSLGSSLS